jgi:putative NIF3 family GTP cyclohydrolase 1 type 2
LPALGIDTLVTGELREEWYNFAEENGLNLYCCGHYAIKAYLSILLLFASNSCLRALNS